MRKRLTVRGIRIIKIEIAGIVTENHFRGQKRNGLERKGNPSLTVEIIKLYTQL